MRFLLDENVRKEVGEFLISKGHSIIWAPKGAKNGEIILLAKKEKSILLTHDIHFANVLLYNHKELAGVIRLRIHPPSVPLLIASLDNLLNKLSEKDIQGKLIILEKDDFRIR